MSLSFRAGLHSSSHLVVWEIALAAVFSSIAFNYLPLLVYASVLIRSGNARHEVALEVEDSSLTGRRYGQLVLSPEDARLEQLHAVRHTGLHDQNLFSVLNCPEIHVTGSEKGRAS